MAADKFRPHHPEEYQRLLKWAKGAYSILEVGSRFGFTLLDLAQGMGGRRIVAVDWPSVGDWGSPGSEEVLKENAETLRGMGFDVHLFIGDSKDPEIVQAVQELGPYDFGFIDGDHAYQGVKADWLNYGPFCKQVVFHDIRKPQAGENQHLEVWRLWAEIEGKKEEFLAEGSKMGIGRAG